ncbi:hypothetical protein QOZ80_1BG0060110 [Eleusine coracana subsp. coracana]|nr:hypothetical protein QOZ80_1BG0060110 [Eleusine coracana subsp. coracana]
MISISAVKQIFMLVLVLVIRWAEGQPQIYNVRDFHACGDGETDDAEAFLTTWQAACNDSGQPIMVIPGGRTFLLTQVRFEGPCKSPITVQLDGKIIAPNQTWTSVKGNLVTFYRVDNLTLDGCGAMDGQGAIWWDCFNRKRCHSRPILLAFAYCNNLVVRSMHLTNSADKHMTLFNCSQVQVNSISIRAPGDSPNTDGITMASSNNVSISNCSIQTGDDCVSILSHTRNVNITDSTCGPGHGISVGSLGGSEIAQVEQITVSNCNFFETMTGVRIKSWQNTPRIAH